MKISQLDYSSIQSANSARQAARQDTENNKSIRMTQAVFKNGMAALDRNVSLQRRATKLNTQIQQSSNLAQLVTAGLNVVQTGVSLGQQIHQAKIQADTEKANQMYLGMVGELNSYATQNAGSLVEFDEQGNAKMSEGFEFVTEALGQRLESAGFDKSVTEATKTKWLQSYWATANTVMRNETATYRNQGLATLEAQLNDYAKEMDWANSQGLGQGHFSTEAGYSLIDAAVSRGVMTKSAGDGLKTSYRSAMESYVRGNSYQQAANEGNLPKAMSLIQKDLDEGRISEQEAADYRTSTARSYAQQTEVLTAFATDAAQKAYDEGKSFEGVYEDVRRITGYDGMDANARKAVDTAIRGVQTAAMLKEFPELADSTSLTPSEADSLLERMREDAKGVFYGNEGQKESLLKSVEESPAGLLSDALGNVDAKVKESISSLDQMLQGIADQYEAGNISFDNAKFLMGQCSDEAVEAVRRQYAEGKAADAGDEGRRQREYAKEHGSMEGYVESSSKWDAGEQDAINSVRETQWQRLNKLTKKSLPDPYRAQFDNWLKGIKEVDINGDGNFSEEEAEQVAEAKLRMAEEVSAWVCSMPEKDITADKLQKLLDEAREGYLGDLSGIVVDIALGKKAMVTDKLLSDVPDAGNAHEAWQELFSRPELVADTPDPFSEWGDTLAKSNGRTLGVNGSSIRREEAFGTFSQLVAYGQTELEYMGYHTEGMAVQLTRNDSGELVAVPEWVKAFPNGTVRRFRVDGSELQSRFDFPDEDGNLVYGKWVSTPIDVAPRGVDTPSEAWDAGVERRKQEERDVKAKAVEKAVESFQRLKRGKL